MILAIDQHHLRDLLFGRDNKKVNADENCRRSEVVLCRTASMRFPGLDDTAATASRTASKARWPDLDENDSRRDSSERAQEEPSYAIHSDVALDDLWQ